MIFFFCFPFFQTITSNVHCACVTENANWRNSQIHLVVSKGRAHDLLAVWPLAPPSGPGKNSTLGKTTCTFITIILVGNSVASSKFQILRKKSWKWLYVICKSWWLKIKDKLGYLQSTSPFFQSLTEENCVNTEMETDHIATEWFYLFYNVNHISTIKC